MYVAAPPPTDLQLLDTTSYERLLEILSAPPDPRSRDRYLHWDKLRHLDPPIGMSSEDWWRKVKFERKSGLRPLPLTDASGAPFRYGLPDQVLRGLRHVDRRCSGEVAMEEVVTSDRQAGQRFLVNSLMEEAIRSSQLEGATTSRQAAKELLRSGREPKNRSERMIVNNFSAMQFMRSEMGRRLTPELLLELHRIVTEGTLDDPSAAGRLQLPGEERVAVFDRDDGRPIHRPPAAEQLPRRMRLLCDFANEGEDGERFVHPVIRAILLHFWLAYDHPFLDGNGRTARILFYWSMSVSDYWLVEYLPISKILREAPARYARSFLETETDEGDATYFLIYQLQVIERAIEDLYRYLKRRTAAVQKVEELIKGADELNSRQVALLSDALDNPGRSYSLGQHAKAHGVTHETSRSDLSRLVERDLLARRRVGREYVFEPPPDLSKRLKELAE
ncbi:MAG TPA: Fic family protein [Solirubrobacterales bacterium]|nr:Fic family protein [Solirubrobacterales bacterium]